MNNDSRFEEIYRRIKARKAEEAAQPKTDALTVVLDSLNALGVLEEVKNRPPPGLSCYGPKTFRGSTESSLFWLGVLVWHKPKGYGHYQTLGLLGIWAVKAEGAETIEIVVGEKSLEFSAPIFNPESYFRHLKKGFNVYYAGDASPPPVAVYQTSYQAEERLMLRERLESVISDWKQSQARR